jgi:hypothetical protein
VHAGCLRGKAAKKHALSRRSRLAGRNCEIRLTSPMISQWVARNGKCAWNVSSKSPRKGKPYLTLRINDVSGGEQGRSRIAFGAGLSWTENPGQCHASLNAMRVLGERKRLDD